MSSAARSRQPEMPGCAPDVGGLLRLKAKAPMRPGKPQRPCDLGLFSDEADQLDLVEMFQDPAED